MQDEGSMNFHITHGHVRALMQDEGSMLKACLFQLSMLQMDTAENLVGFSLSSYRQCKNLWKACVEHHTFFRLHAPPPPRPTLFSFQSKFRYRYDVGGSVTYQNCSTNHLLMQTLL